MGDKHSCAWHLGIPSLVCDAFKNVVFITCGIVVVHHAQSLTSVYKRGEGYVSRILQSIHFFRPSQKLTFPCSIWGRIETVECVFATIHKIPFLHALVVVFRNVAPVNGRVEIGKSHGMAHLMEKYTYACEIWLEGLLSDFHVLPYIGIEGKLIVHTIAINLLAIV